jgi:autotransporter translocation and assembly factor TamB
MSVTLDGALAGPARDGRQPADLPVKVVVAGERVPSPGDTQVWELRRLSGTGLGVTMRSTGRARLELDPREMRLDGLSMAGDLGVLTASVRAARNGSVAADLSLTGLRFETLPPSLLPTSVGLSGSLGGSVVVTGSTGRPHIETHWKLSHAGLRGTGPAEVSVDGTLADGRVQARIQGSLATGGAFDLQASLPARAPDLSSAEPVGVRFSLDRLGLAGLAPALPAARDLDGVLTSSVELSGSWRAPRLASETTWSGLGALGVTGLDGQLTADWKDDLLAVTGEASNAGSMHVAWSAEAPLSSLVLEGVLPGPESWPVEASVVLEKLDLGWLSKVRPELGPLGGQVAGRLTAGGTMAAPALEGSLAAGNLALHGYRDIDVVVDLHGDARVEGALQVRREGRDLASVRWHVPRSTETLRQEFADWRRIPLSLEATLLPTPLPMLVPPGAAWAAEGNLAARLRFEGTFDTPDLHLRSTIDELRMNGDPRGTLTVAADLDAAKAALEARFLSHRAGGLLLSASMATPLAALEQPDAAPFDAKLSMDGFDLSTLDGLVAGVRGVAGRLDAAVTVGGTAGHPRADGRIRLADGRVGLVEYGAFERVAMDLTLDNQGATLRDLSGRSGSGSFVLSGTARREEDVVTADAHARLRALPLVQNDQTRGYLTVDVDAGDIVLRGRTLRVPNLLVSKGLLRIPERPQKSVQPLEPHPDFVVAGEAPSAPASSPPPVTASVNIVIPDDFKVEAPLGNTLVLGADLEARLDPALAADGRGAFDLSGKVRLPRGSIQLLQARFDVQPTSSVTLYPRQFLDPTLDISARHESRGVEVTAAFTGTASSPVRRLTARPEMDESEVLYFIATGQRQQRAQTDPFSLSQQSLDDTLVGLVGSIGSSFAKSYLTKYLGKAADLDVLSLDTRGNARVGTYLWHGKLYLGGQVRPNANVLTGENSAELNAEYRIGEHSFGRLRVGDQNRNALELLYQDNVPARSQRKAKQNR